MAFGVEEYNEETAQSRYKAGTTSGSYNTECNYPPELRFVEGLGPNYMKIHGGRVDSGSTMDPWVTRYPGSKMK